MKFVFLLTVPAYGESILYEIHQLCLSVLKTDELSVFMYGDGVFNALSTLSPASDEYSVSSRWNEIHSLGAKIYFCESAGKRRGVLASNSLPFCQVSTLGELSSLISMSDRLVVF